MVYCTEAPRFPQGENHHAAPARATRGSRWWRGGVGGLWGSASASKSQIFASGGLNRMARIASGGRTPLGRLQNLDTRIYGNFLRLSFLVSKNDFI